MLRLKDNQCLRERDKDEECGPLCKELLANIESELSKQDMTVKKEGYGRETTIHGMTSVDGNRGKNPLVPYSISRLPVENIQLNLSESVVLVEKRYLINDIWFRKWCDQKNWEGPFKKAVCSGDPVQQKLDCKFNENEQKRRELHKIHDEFNYTIYAKPKIINKKYVYMLYL